MVFKTKSYYGRSNSNLTVICYSASYYPQSAYVVLFNRTKVKMPSNSGVGSIYRKAEFNTYPKGRTLRG